MADVPVLIVPGLHGSGPLHWQSLWQDADPAAFQRVSQRDWDRPDLLEWLESLRRHVAGSDAPPVLVAHSLGCALVVHWVARTLGRGVKAALLVSPSDVDSAAHTPPEVRGFGPMPLLRFPFPSIVVASTDDPRVELARAEHFARSWGSRLVTVGTCGHINENSGLGDWPQGRALLGELLHRP